MRISPLDCTQSSVISLRRHRHQTILQAATGDFGCDGQPTSASLNAQDYEGIADKFFDSGSIVFCCQRRPKWILFSHSPARYIRRDELASSPSVPGLLCARASARNSLCNTSYCQNPVLFCLCKLKLRVSFDDWAPKTPLAGDWKHLTSF
jgi:hypothetical protein